MLITDKVKLASFHSCHRVWQGIPGIARTKKDRTFLSLYSGSTGETYGNYALLLQSDTDRNFSEPIAVAKKDGAFRCFDPVVWVDPLNRLWFIWNVMPGEEVYASVCEDPDADTLEWSDEFYIGRGVMMNKPTVLTTGEWLFPIAFWKKDIRPGFRKNGYLATDIAGSYVYKTSDNGKTFTKLGMSDIRDRSYDEHMVLERNNGVLMMLVRTTYGIGASYSYDRGKTWSKGEDSRLGGPCSRFYISRLSSGRILLINHVNFTGRNNLTALLSEDDGKTFPYALLLDERDQVAYPDAVEGNDGFLYITYDRERGNSKKSLAEAYSCAREVLTAKITEADIIHGSIVSEGSFLKNSAHKLGTLHPDDPNPYEGVNADVRDFVDRLLCEDKDILTQIFLRYPIDCTLTDTLDIVKLDTLITQFHESGETDRELLLKIVQLVSTPPTNPDPHPMVSRISAYINEHLTEDIPIKTIAQKLNISVFYLSHLFKSVTGINPVEYRNEQRLTKAKQMLISTDASMSQIATECGFGSASYFAEVFAASEKIAPTQYRKCHKKP